MRALRRGDLLRPAGAGAGHGDAQAAVGLRGLLHGRLDLVLVTHVAGCELEPELGGERLAALLVDVGDRHGGAALVEAPDGGLAEARRTADDERSCVPDVHGANPNGQSLTRRRPAA